MRRILFIMAFTLLVASAQAQVLKPVKWGFTAAKKSAGLYEVHMTATIDKGWTTYSQWTPEGGPEPTVITFNKNPNVLLGGKAKEIGGMKKKHEEAFGVDVHYFSGKVDFVQVVKLKKATPTTLTGKVSFMTCDSSQCLPPEEVNFSVQLK
ncbi:protein-disulfide reductase DsbD domain-containing protein [Pedobacter ginsengisoli]|uniref:protein-disulfide reductase DsbD domain-containing protein n=1 Tax=Pedobacter ginsengisoli TaxID=363852 RepID=UPI00255143E6|nr:protein-disulfide reductase DsbD domain-containing protein [Pedobacter ginsengisoli]